MSDKPELKPCPFCGGEASVMYSGKFTTDLTRGEESSQSSEYWIKCVECQVSQWHHGTVLSAKEAWNQRADLAKSSEWISGPCPTCQTDPESNGAMISGWLEINRTHEECADCRFLYSANPPCKGHNSGPVCCPRFKPARETP